MDILQARVALRERTLLDVVDLTVRFLARHARPYARMGAIVLIPAFAATLFVAMHAGWGWGWTSAFLLGALAQTPFTVLASRLVFEPVVRVRGVLGQSARSVPRLLVIRAMELLGLVVGTLFFVLPAVWLGVVFLFVSEVMVLEQASIGVALGRMHRLVWGQLGDAMMAFLFLLSLHIIVVFVGDATGRAILEGLLEITAPPSLWDEKGSALALASFWLFVPFGATCRFLLYLNVRTRTEGWDIQTRFVAIAARTAQATAVEVGP